MSGRLPAVIALCASLAPLLPALAWGRLLMRIPADLVEIIPDALPNKGDTVDVRNYSNDETTTCLVVSVTRNSRTVEIVVRTPDGEAHTLVMEGCRFQLSRDGRAGIPGARRDRVMPIRRRPARSRAAPHWQPRSCPVPWGSWTADGRSRSRP